MAVRCLSTVILTPFTLHIFETTHLDDTHPLPCSRSFDLKIVTASTATFKELPWQMKMSLSKKKSRPLQRQTAAELVQSLPNPLIILKNNHNFGGLKVYIASPDNQKWFFFFFFKFYLLFFYPSICFTVFAKVILMLNLDKFVSLLLFCSITIVRVSDFFSSFFIIISCSISLLGGY